MGIALAFLCLEGNVRAEAQKPQPATEATEKKDAAKSQQVKEPTPPQADVPQPSQTEKASTSPESAGEASPSQNTVTQEEKAFLNEEAVPEEIAELMLGEQATLTSAKQLSVSGRIDPLLSTGNGVVQGFSLPSLRVALSGSLHPQIGFLVALGQTREFSTVLLPQILPVEAFVELGIEALKSTPLKIKFGLFTPQQNPLWAPDLGELDLPSYHASHNQVFLSRELGAELEVRPIPQLRFGIGAANGTGLLTQNTNNSKAVTGFAELNFGQALQVTVGTGGYGRFQSVSGNINYREYIAGNVYASLKYRGHRLSVSSLFGSFNDNLQSVRTNGLTLTFWGQVFPSWWVFLRAESLNQPPQLSVNRLERYEIGPFWRIHEGLKMFLTYEIRQEGSGKVQATHLRLRLNV